MIQGATVIRSVGSTSGP